MKYLIEIDDTTKAGKSLLSIAQTISEKNKGVVILDEESDTVSFDVFATELKKSINKRLAKKTNSK
jgi:hypothetical protein